MIARFASGEDIVRYEPAPPMAGTTGDIEALSLWAGQSVGLARKAQPAAEIVAELTSRLLAGTGQQRQARAAPQAGEPAVPDQEGGHVDVDDHGQAEAERVHPDA